MKTQILSAMVLLLLLALPGINRNSTAAPGTREMLWPVLVKYTATLNNKDLPGHISCFASSVNWFGKKMTRTQLKKIISDLFKKYETLSMTLLEEFKFSRAGATAAVDCRKMWSFCDEDSGEGFCGMVEAEFGFILEGGEWKINSVEDRSVIWVEKRSPNCCEEY